MSFYMSYVLCYDQTDYGLSRKDLLSLQFCCLFFSVIVERMFDQNIKTFLEEEKNIKRQEAGQRTLQNVAAIL